MSRLDQRLEGEGGRAAASTLGRSSGSRLLIPGIVLERVDEGVEQVEKGGRHIRRMDQPTAEPRVMGRRMEAAGVLKIWEGSVMPGTYAMAN